MSCLGTGGDDGVGGGGGGEAHRLTRATQCALAALRAIQRSDRRWRPGGGAAGALSPPPPSTHGVGGALADALVGPGGEATAAAPQDHLTLTAVMALYRCLLAASDVEGAVVAAQACAAVAARDAGRCAASGAAAGHPDNDEGDNGDGASMLLPRRLDAAAALVDDLAAEVAAEAARLGPKFPSDASAEDASTAAARCRLELLEHRETILRAQSRVPGSRSFAGGDTETLERADLLMEKCAAQVEAGDIGAAFDSWSLASPILEHTLQVAAAAAGASGGSGGDAMRVAEAANGIRSRLIDSYALGVTLSNLHNDADYAGRCAARAQQVA